MFLLYRSIFFILFFFNGTMLFSAEKILFDNSGNDLFKIYEFNVYPTSNLNKVIHKTEETIKFTPLDEKDHITTPFVKLSDNYDKTVFLELRNNSGNMSFYIQDENYNNIYRDTSFEPLYKQSFVIPSHVKKIRLLFKEAPGGYIKEIELPYSIKIINEGTYNWRILLVYILITAFIFSMFYMTIKNRKKKIQPVSFSGKCFIFLVVVILSISVLELAGRYLLNMKTWTEQRSFLPYFGYGDLLNNTEKAVAVIDNDYGYKSKNGYFYNSFQNNSALSVNSLGKPIFDHYLSRYSMKETDYLINKSPDAIKIFVIGGSVAQGTSASAPSKTWHCLLEKKLRDFFKRNDIYVFNVAMGGFVSTQERIVYDMIVSPRKPDIVIDVTMLNDMNQPIYYSILPGHPYMTSVRYMELYGNSFTKLLSNNSVFFWYFYRTNYENFIVNQRKMIVDDKEKLKVLSEGVKNIFWENIFHMASCSKNNKVEFLLFIQPSIYYTEYILNLPPSDKIAFYDKNIGKTLTDIYKETELKIEKANEQGFKFYSLMKIIDDKNKMNLYSDIAHFYDDGQILMSEKIFIPVKDAIDKTMLKRKSANINE